jgi:hypothetical protein
MISACVSGISGLLGRGVLDVSVAADLALLTSDHEGLPMSLVGAGWRG